MEFGPIKVKTKVKRLVPLTRAEVTFGFKENAELDT